ncbi:MAG: branched-chain amino acid transaminase [bacterium]
MAPASQFLPIAYFEGKLTPFKDANISIATNALHYGTAAFGGMRGIINPENPNEVLLFRLDAHTKRLSRSATYLRHEISPKQIEKAILETIKANKPTGSFYVRPLVYASGLVLTPTLHTVKKDLCIYLMALEDYLPASGVSCCFSSWMRQMDASLPLRGKMSGTYITSGLAKAEASDRGFDEALLMNSQGKVSEGSGMNIFLVRNGQLITPGVEHDILEGITRDSVIILAKELGMEVVERPVDKSELLIADEVFLTGTAAKVTPVNRIENVKFKGPYPVAEKLKAELTRITEGKGTDHKDWVTAVPLDG